MRRGYWTGFIMGGLLGMLAAKAYGDRLVETLLPGMAGSRPMDDIGMDEDEESFSIRPSRRRRRYRRAF